MAGRRRVRLLLAILLFALAAVIYTRRHYIEPVADYVRSNVVGGGSILREKPGDQRPLAPSTTQPVPTRPIVFARPTPSTSSSPGRQDHKTTASSSLESLVPITPSTIQRPTTVAHVSKPTRPPPVLGNEGLPYKDGEGRKDAPQLLPSESMIHWEKQSEHFPVSTTIQLPTGSSKPFPRIQYAGKMEADTDRLAIIKAATKHAWDGYVEAAFEEDEVSPISGGFKNPFNGWGATLVDSLDTLWMMGMYAEFEEAVQAVGDIDFTTSMRPDIPLFETTIRYLGGLVAAYDISDAEYPILLDKAVEIAEILFGVFDTPNGMPMTFYRWKPAFTSQPHRASNKVVLAELGSLSLEFTRLAQIIGEPKFYDAIARITNELEKWQNGTRLPGMWPSQVDASGCQKPAENNQNWEDGLQQLLPDGLGGSMVAGPPVAAGMEEAIAPKALQDKVPTESIRSASTLQQGTSMSTQAAAFNVKTLEDSQPTSSLLPDNEGRRERIPTKAKRQIDAAVDLPTLDLNPAASSDETAGTDAAVGIQYARTAAGTFNINPEGAYASDDVCIEQGLNSTSKYILEVFTLGGQSDSLYEYLPKQYVLLGGLVEQYKDMYLYSAQTEIDNLLYRPMTPDNRDILMAGEMMVGINMTDDSLTKTLFAQNSHLTCFAGGMLALGGRLFNRPEHIDIGWKLTDGCVWAYNATATGIMPESFMFLPCDDPNDCRWNQSEYWQHLDPYEEVRTKLHTLGTVQSTSTLSTSHATVANSLAVTATEQASQILGATIAEARSQPSASSSQLSALGPDGADGLKRPTEAHLIKRRLAEVALNEPHTAEAGSTTLVSPSFSLSTSHFVWTAPTPLPHEEYVQKKIIDERLPPGMVSIVSRKYILRPEAIESVFYMYRITGDQYWRDVGWDMFTAIDKHTRAPYGNSAIDDVTKAAPDARDAMESFWIAETLKYFYLLYDDGTTWSLDEWVLNTEAHFFRRPKYRFAE